MWFVALYYLTAVGYAVGAHPVTCSSNDECGEGHYCEISAHRCIECLQCGNLKRQPPPFLPENSCVKTLVDCGPCLEGLVVDHRDVNAECVFPESQGNSPILPVYSWVFIGIAIIIVIGMAVCFYLYRKPEIFKASMSNCSLFVGPSEVSQASPDLPPPYNPDYSFVPSQNRSYAPPADWTNPPVDDTAQPFIKRVPSAQPQDARERADTQRARIFNRPAYSYQEEEESVCSPESDEHRDDKYSPPSPWMPPVDEETVESMWTPQELPQDNNTGNTNKRVRRAPSSDDEDEAGESDGAPSRPLALLPAVTPASPASPAELALPAPAVTADACDTPSQGPSSAKRACVRQESRNNRHQDSSAGSSTSGAGMNQQPTSDTQTALFINVVINNNKLN
ncbi:uncharacterized protein LOC115445822 isoform X2 [Manduca sexta]|uniref:uncharacterized protein LOC115445822 isoform X2 n=1 Tax=Manduca sexta TaxID=7130 RepID=UPI00188F6DF5|nr:uncharacterized protein LOC115445822 isoform X2 [Manduca sexta]